MEKRLNLSRNQDKKCRLQAFEHHPEMQKARFSPSTSIVTGGLLGNTLGMHDNPSVCDDL